MRLTRERLGSWLEESTHQEPYPDLSVDSERADLLEASIPGLREMPPLSPHDPGCYLFYVDRSELREAGFDTDSDALMMDRVVERVARAAERASRRLNPEVAVGFHEHDEHRRAQGRNDPTAGESFILLSDGRSVASVGPGGHVALEYRNNIVMGTASVRPFSERPQPSGPWVNTDYVLQSLAGFLGGDVEVFPAVGYYERSWMEHQEAISASLVFLLEWTELDMYPRRQEIVLPATAPSDPVTRAQTF